MAQKLSPLSRTLEVLQLVGRYGPIKLKELHDKTTISPAALQRFVAQLVQEGWMQRLAPDKELVLSHAMEELFSTAHFNPIEIDAIQPVLEQVKKDGTYHLTMSMFASQTNLADVASSKSKETYLDHYSIIFAPTAHSAQAVMEREARAKLVLKYAEHATAEEVVALKSGDHMREVIAVRERGYAISPTLPAIHWAQIAKTFAICVFTLEPVALSKSTAKQFLENSQALYAEFPAQTSAALT